VKCLVIACNTASAVGLTAVSERIRDVPVIGVIEPGAEAACAASRSGQIAVIATEGTVRGGAYQDAIVRRRSDARVSAVPAQLFVALAEEGLCRGPIAESVARHYLEPLFNPSRGGSRPDTLVLGCTHFPMLVDSIRAVAGRHPRGWLGPGLTETWETPDLLVEEGYEYVCDWVLDDQPVMLQTRTRPIVSIPYTQECNDVAMMLIQHHKAGEYYDRAIDQFEQLYSDAAESARIMALVVHPYIMGAPHRLKYFRNALLHIRERPDVLFWTGEEILDWYLSQQPRERPRA